MYAQVKSAAGLAPLLVLFATCCSFAGAADRRDGGLHPYPLWPSTPVPGWPGVDADENHTAEKLTGGTPDDPRPAVYGQPEFLAYPGAVHHLRHFLQRYVPPYPLNNAKTLVRNFILHEMRGYGDKCVRFEERVYYNPMYGKRSRTAQKRPPVQAYPLKPGSAAIKLDIGKLPRSVYAIRPVVAAPAVTEVVDKGRKFALFRLRINDMPNQPGGMNEYVLKACVLDNFYAVTEFYFHSRGDGRSFKAELALLPESEMELLLYNVDLHDRFVEHARRRGKRRAVLDYMLPGETKARAAHWEKNRTADPGGYENAKKNSPAKTPEQQKASDDEVWKSLMPPLNCHYGGGWYCQRIDLDQLRICRAPDSWRRFVEAYAADRPLLLGCKTGKLYLDENGALHVSRPSSVQREFKVPPGLYYDSAVVSTMNRGGNVTGTNHGRYHPSIEPWAKFGIRQIVRDQAMKFIRLVYDVPAMQMSRNWEYVAGFEGLDRAMLRTPGHAMGSSGSTIAETLTFYDTIYPFLATDREFAAAVGRYLPWIKTPDDLIEFVDVYLVQDYANNVMKYRIFTDHEQAKWMMTAVLVQNDSSITDPWMEFLFKRGWEYPQALSGLGDNLATGTDRDGGTTIGSFMYAMGGATATMELMEKYIRYGGNKKYDLTDPRQYPAVRLKPYFLLEGNAAGRVNPGIGDVGGVAEHHGRFTNAANYRDIHAAGWRWHKDPKFAWELVNTFGRTGESDQEWAEITNAAAQCPRDPYLMNRSRVLSNWGGYLRLHCGHDDWRFQRVAAVRVGTGSGHAHSDTLDLRLFAFGLTMATDFNQRPAYGWPAHHMTRVHNVVEVDGNSWTGHAWVRNLFDAPGSPYLEAESVAPHGMENVELFRRQVALVDVHEGSAGAGVEDANVMMPSSYVFDVFRVSGGRTHTYCFHGCADDGFEVNVMHRQPPTQAETSPDRGYLRPFRWWQREDSKGAPIGGLPRREEETYWAAKCDGHDLIATWRLDRDAEKSMLRGAVLTEPRKYTRLTLFDQSASRILHGIARAAGGYGYYGRCLYAQKESPEDADNVFVALIEPYAGEPSIVAQRQIRVANNETDARRAVAVEVKTNSGRTDVLFADGRRDKVRELQVTGGKWQVAGEYAYVSNDAGGFRQAALTGGTLLQAPGIRIEAGAAGYEGTITAVGYLDRKVTLQGSIPARLAGHFFEIGNEQHKTTCEVRSIDTRSGRTLLAMRKGLEIMRTRVRGADPATGKVVGAIAMLRHRGRDAGLVASNDAVTRFWRAAYAGGNRHTGHEFILTSMDAKEAQPAFTEADFPLGSGLRVWEFGVGASIWLIGGEPGTGGRSSSKRRAHASPSISAHILLQIDCGLRVYSELPSRLRNKRIGGGITRCTFAILNGPRRMRRANRSRQPRGSD